MICGSLLFSVAIVLANHVLAERHVFRTEPSIVAPVINITTNTNSASIQQNGYVFLAPFSSDEQAHFGPLIYDKAGNLVWSGVETTGIMHRISNFGPCDYLGSRADHLCWTAADMHQGMQHHSSGHWILDDTYSTVAQRLNYTGEVMEESPNVHELNVLAGGRTYLQLVWNQKRIDLSDYNGPRDGVAYDGCFQEVAMENGAIVFVWCLLDHLPPWETYMFPQVENQVNYTERGAGIGDKILPWDFSHINSIDKNDEGDYLVSFRHLCQVMKIAGLQNALGHASGTIIWRLGGRFSTIGIIGSDSVPFSTQHMARFISTNDTNDVISLFNNNYRLQADHPMIPSAGQILDINSLTEEAIIPQRYPHPHGEQAQMMGSTTMLSNGNAFVGWGAVPQFSEFSKDGEVLLHAVFGRNDYDYNYRAYSAPWCGKPEQPPKLLVYRKTCTSSPIVIHVSWNGATEVVAWKVSFKAFRYTPWLNIGVFPKQGFETTIDLSVTSTSTLTDCVNRLTGIDPIVSIEALDADGHVLHTVEAKTFTPAPGSLEASKCDDYGCNDPVAFNYQTTSNYADSCRQRTGPYLGLTLVVLLTLVAVVSIAKQAIAMRFSLNRPLYSLIEDKEG